MRLRRIGGIAAGIGAADKSGASPGRPDLICRREQFTWRQAQLSSSSDLRKQYGSTIALDGVSFGVEAGTVHALLGENGAGKSTIVKLLSGLTRADAGEIQVFSQPVSIGGPRAAHRLGIRIAFQEISLVKDLTVAQNFLLMEEPINAFGLVRRRQAEAIVHDELQKLGLSGIDPRAKVASLDLPTRQKIEIARSVSRDPRLLLLDEPTSSLSSRDVQWLAGLIERVKTAGTTIILISHRMQEVREFCSAMTILRNGKAVGSYAMGEISDDRVIELTIGRSLEVVFPAKQPPRRTPEGAPALAVRGLSAAGAVNDVSFDLWPGQILGVGGLQGMGQRELFLALFGAHGEKRRQRRGERRGGEFTLAGRRSPRRHRHQPGAGGPEDGGAFPRARRAAERLASLAPAVTWQAAWSSAGARHTTCSRRLPASRSLPRALVQPVKQFSGGNQQKIAIAKWLLTGSRILLLYDPTRGVDVGTKAEIYRLVHGFADSGGSVLFYSTDIAELVNLCDGVLVLYRGHVADTLAGAAVTDTQIMRAALGQAKTADLEERIHGHRLH